MLYVALSYGWGNVPVIKTTQRNLKTLREKEALFVGIDGLNLPATIMEAIRLVELPNERYLWVDCLCVIQDAGSEHMDRMLQAMAHIYASAEFTIVAAADKHANHGLSGISTERAQHPTITRRKRCFLRDIPMALSG